MLYYLNDFFIILFLETNIDAYKRQFDKLYNELSLIINYIKNILNIIIDFLGIELDSIFI